MHLSNGKLSKTKIFTKKNRIDFKAPPNCFRLIKGKK